LRKFSLLLGIALLLAGIFSLTMYVSTTRVAYQGATLTNSYLVLGIIAIFIGFIFMLTSVKIPKVHIA
jgi:uncharacterized membrane protein HdeD (DUF308 family)